MTLPTEPTASAGAESAVEPVSARVATRSRRRFQILIAVVIALAALWSVGWFVGRHYAARELNKIERKFAEEGGSITCGGQAITGFPFKFVLDCAPAALALPDGRLNVRVGALEAIGLVYNPLRVIAAAQSPLVMRTPSGLGVNAEWSSAQTSLRVGWTGALKRFSAVADNLDLSLESPDKTIAATDVKAAHAELHLLQADGDATALEIWTSAQALEAMLPSTPKLPPLTGDLHAILPGALPVLKGGPIDPVEPWLAAGGKVQLGRLGVEIGGFMAVASGDLTVTPDGLISGKVDLRLDQLDRLPALAEGVHPGSGEKVAQIIGPLSAFLKPVTVDGKIWRETTITLNKSRASVGFIPLGKIPPLKLRRG
jgi:hypothetical protein